MTIADLGKLIVYVIAFHVACFLLGCALGFYPH